MQERHAKLKRLTEPPPHPGHDAVAGDVEHDSPGVYEDARRAGEPEQAQRYLVGVESASGGGRLEDRRVEDRTARVGEEER